jgi:hypothetical protein
MSSHCKITISMSDETVTELLQNGFSLYGLHAVKAAGNARPVVWYQTKDFALTTGIAWTEGYQAYTSRSQIIPNGRIIAMAAYDIHPGLVLTVDSPMGTGEVTSGGSPGAISIFNQTISELTCGLAVAQPCGSGFAPVCALPLFGYGMVLISSVPRVFLVFESMRIDPGTVVGQAYGQGILIDLSDAPARSVSYDINRGWSWENEASWARTVPPNTALGPLLVTSLGE